MITSKENQLIKYIKSLSQKKYREQNHEYIVEGAKMSKEAIESDEVKVSKVVICEELLTNNKELYSNFKKILDEKNMLDSIEYVSKVVFEYISDTMSPQGIMIIIKEKQQVSEDYSNVVFALDDLQDPGNLGTIIRTLDSAGYKDLILSQGSAEVYNPKVVRSTMGAIFRLKLHTNINLKDELEKLKSNGYKIVITSLETEKYYYDLKFTEKMVIVIGNESKGVSKEIQDIADIKIKIPMLGKTESLNAAVAASIIAYEGVRQKFATIK